MEPSVATERKRYYVVFNNDWALSVALTQEQADCEVARLKREDKSKKLPGSNITANYFHWHDVPEVAS